MKLSSLNIFSRKLEQHLFKKFLKIFFLCITACLLIIFLVEFVELLRRTSENPNVSSVFYVVYLSFFKITESISYIIPISFFVTTMMTCRTFNKHREMVIMQNAGLHSFRILYPFMFFTIIFCIIYFTFLNPIFSNATNSYQKIEQEIFRGKLSKASISKSGIWLRQGSENNKIVIRAENFLPEENLFKNTTFYIYTKKNNFIERIDAEKAQIEKNFWTMKKVIINKPNKKVVEIDEYTLKTNLSIKKIEDSFLEPQSLSIWKIPDFISLLKESGFSATKHKIYLYKTLFLPLYLIGLILIAGSFTIKFTKTNPRKYFLILSGAITGFLIHVLSETIYSLGIADKLPTILASLSPSIITIMVGVYFVIHFENTS
tara:strand:+ start:521 stop:1642 length:1122 start_codon:yes stop_codon:yes gene_type:complete